MEVLKKFADYFCHANSLLNFIISGKLTSCLSGTIFFGTKEELPQIYDLQKGFPVGISIFHFPFFGIKFFGRFGNSYAGGNQFLRGNNIEGKRVAFFCGTLVFVPDLLKLFCLMKAIELDQWYLTFLKVQSRSDSGRQVLTRIVL